MTTIIQMEKTCAVCGAVSTQCEAQSANSQGDPDLDLRPSEMLRGTMGMWVQQCPNCGYCNADLELETSVSFDYLASREYQSLFPEIDPSSLAARFLYQVKIADLDGHVDNIPYLYMYAAWDCDDMENLPGAVRCRLAALDAFDEFADSLTQSPNNVTCLKVDLFRRCGRFSDAISTAESLLKLPVTTIMSRILAFQIERSKAMDMAAYQVCDAIKMDR